MLCMPYGCVERGSRTFEPIHTRQILRRRGPSFHSAQSFPSVFVKSMKTRFLKSLLSALSSLAVFYVPSLAHSSIAYGSINNFDTVNDTNLVCHGFEIEIEDCSSTNITYTYNYNHYGVPNITEDNSVVGHPKCIIRWESKKNTDGSWAAYTAIPTAPIAPTDGHMFTNPSVNFGGEHFGVGYSAAVGAVRYNWLVDNGTGQLVRGGVVQISTPVYSYIAPMPGVAAQVQAVIQPPPPPAIPPKEFGSALWMKEIRTTTHSNQEIKLRELVSDNPNKAGEKNWTNGEPDEVEVEWQLLQKDYGKADGGANNEIAAAPEDLPNNDEVVTRRYEFYKYVGPTDNETGEAMADTVAADNLHGSGNKTINGADVDLATVVIVGAYVGAQMAAVDVDAPVGLIDHVGEARVGLDFAPRTLVIMGATPFVAAMDGNLPPGMTFDEVTGVLSGTPSASGNYQFKITASDGIHPDVAKNYTLSVFAANADAPPTVLLDTTCMPVNGGTTSGDGSYAPNGQANVTATPAPGFTFVQWTDNGQVVSSNATYMQTMDVNHSLVAHFLPTYAVTTSSSSQAGGTTTGSGTFAEGQSVTVTAVPAVGYAFTNWTENGGIVSSTATFTFSVASNRELVANFTQGVSYSITTLGTPSAGGSTTGSGIYASGANVNVTAIPNAGYSFVSWMLNGTVVSQTASYNFTASANQNLTANFAVVTGTQRSITTTASPIAGGTTLGAGVYADGANVTVTAVAAPGYRFSKWKEGNNTVSSTAAYTFTATTNRTLTATFIQSYYVTATAAPATSGTTEMDSSSYKLDDTAKAFAYPAAGYEFISWTENGTVVSTQTPYSFKVTGNRDLVANFSLIGGVSITATPLPPAGGTVTGAGSYQANAMVSLQATPAVGYVFLGWLENSTLVNASENYPFPATTSRTLIASFAMGHKIDVAANPAEGGAASGGGFVATGASTTVTATASPSYNFVGWTTSEGTVVSNEATYTFTPTVNDSLTAQFEAQPSVSVFDFDSGVPALSLDSFTPLNQTNASCTVSLSSPTPGAFKVTNETASGKTLSKFTGNYLACVTDGGVLTIQFDQPVTGVSLDFATVEGTGRPVASNLQLTAFDTSSGNPVSVGVGLAHGTVTVGDSDPVGTLNFSSTAGTFDQIVLQLPDAPTGALRFLLDNLSVSLAGNIGGTLLLVNPNWNITLTDFGYSDFLLDNTPGFEGREYLSGEWGTAVSYTREGSATTSPQWLQPMFLFPDWRTNSTFHVVTHIHSVGTNADGLPIAESVIANDDLEITLRYEMVDTVTGTPMGVTPASSATAARAVTSNRYVLHQSFKMKNVSGAAITGLQLFQLLHGFISQKGQYDDRLYAGKMAEYRYDVTMSGIDSSAAGEQSSTAGLEDMIGFQSKVAPTAFEIGHYGLETSGVDDHVLGKPSDGVHLSIENNWASAPYAARRNRDSFAPADRWISGGQRWELGALPIGQSVNFDILLSLLTGTKVVVNGSGGNQGNGSCNGGSSHAGGVDFQFDDIRQEGTFFGEYSEADDNEMQERETEGEFALPGFETPAGVKRQRWNLSYSGTHVGNIRLRFAYDANLLPASYDENQLVIYHFRNGAWEKLACKVDPTTNTIEAITPSLSPFMLGINDQVVKPDVQLSSTVPGALDVTWDASFNGWLLQESANLSTWTNSARIINTNVGRNSVNVPLSAGMRFFRLVRP